MRQINPFKQNGFSLLEVLVSVFVLGVGLLGLAALQINTLQYNGDSHFRSIAVHQSHEIIDRMRANPSGITAGNYNALSGTPSNPSCTASCTPAQIAQRDANTWNTENAQLLPLGSGTVSSLGNSLFQVTVRWDGHRTGATGTNCSGNSAVDLTCFRMDVQL